MLNNINILATKFTELSSGVMISNKITAGYLSENFVVVSGGRKYFLKQYRFKEKRRIVDAHKAKLFFASKGVPVIIPLKNNEGETITQIGNVFVSLFPFVEGFQFVSKGTTVPAQAPKSLGIMLGRIHKAGESRYPEISEVFKSWNKDEFFEDADSILEIINNKKILTDFDRQAKEAIEFKKKCVKEEKLSLADMEGLRTGLIHGDYHDGNVFFDKDGTVTHVFDFEKTCIAPCVFEIIRAMQYSYSTGHNRPGSEKYIGEFLNGYRTERPVSDEELKLGKELFYQREIHGLWVEKEHYLKNNSRVDMLLHTKKYLQDLSRGM